MDPIYYFDYETPIGWINIGCSQNKLFSCTFGKTHESVWKLETDYHKKIYQQLQEYFHGTRKDFDIEYDLIQGTAFQRKVWEALLSIPYGQTTTYRDIAIKVNSPKAYRAVGNANNKNPIAIFFPCHRVIGTNGNLIGYAGGLEIKKYLLDLEKGYK